MVKGPTIKADPKISQCGSSVVLEAVVEADPTPIVQWLKDNKVIHQGDNQYIMKMETLDSPNTCKYIMQIEEFDKPLAGIYKCVIENEHGKTAASFKVTAGDVPDFLDPPQIIQKDNGKTLSVKIRVKSKVRPTVEWSKNDQPLKENHRIKLTQQKGEHLNEYLLFLEIKGPKKMDEATYKCTVKNNDGSNCQTLDLTFE